MRPFVTRLGLALTSALVVSACGGVVGELPDWDAAVPLDAGSADDGGPEPSDAGEPQLDAGTSPEDAGLDADAGGGPLDAGHAFDAGGTFDAGGALDAGATSDAGSLLLPDGGCNPGAFARLAWPFPGTNGVDWVVNNYVDLDRAGSGLRDFTGATGTAAKTYDGHRGIDIDVPSFRQMDADFPVLAAAAGVVLSVVDGNFDRNTSCASNSANLVRIRQDDCSVALYAHFKQSSIRVAVGQRIVAGQPLAVVGSSGCSTGPHVHFELNDAAGALEEPFSTGRWLAPPPYTTSASVLDLNFKAGSYSDFNELKDPPPDAVTLPAGSAIGVASNTANGRPGDVLSMRMLRPDGGVGGSGSLTFAQDYRHSWWWWNRTLGSERGQWTLELRVNGGAPTVRRFTVP